MLCNVPACYKSTGALVRCQLFYSTRAENIIPQSPVGKVPAGDLFVRFFTSRRLPVKLYSDMAKFGENSVGIVRKKTIRLMEQDKLLELDCGRNLAPIDVAYETYGQLNEAGDNVVLICHALSGDAHVAGYNSPDDKKPGWWDAMVGPGKGIDTDKYFVVCSNFLGGCGGTTGPSSINPRTGRDYGLDFPIITISDMVKVQKLLLDRLGIKELLAVIGGSIGGMQVLQWALAYPEFVRAYQLADHSEKLKKEQEFVIFLTRSRDDYILDYEIVNQQLDGPIAYVDVIVDRYSTRLTDRYKYRYTLERVDGLWLIVNLEATVLKGVLKGVRK